MEDKPKIYYDKKFFDFDGVKWVPVKPKTDNSYLVGYKGHSFMEVIDPAIHIYCPYIPTYHDSGSK